MGVHMKDTWAFEYVVCVLTCTHTLPCSLFLFHVYGGGVENESVL